MISANRLFNMAGGVGIRLADDQLDRLCLYSTLLLEWNERFNLTAITQPQEIEEKHFLDCLLLANRPEVRGEVVDVGSGAGFPGVVIALFRPDCHLTLLEPTGKRTQFLSEAVKQLGLKAKVVKERAEEAARKEWRERFDTATARAVAAMPALCEYCLPLVRPGGTFIAMKGGAVEEELGEAAVAIQKLGGQAPGRVEHYTLPSGDGRSLIFINKTGQTPKAYPRNGGVIKKRPL